MSAPSRTIIQSRSLTAADASSVACAEALILVLALRVATRSLRSHRGHIRIAVSLVRELAVDRGAVDERFDASRRSSQVAPSAFRAPASVVRMHSSRARSFVEIIGALHWAA